MALTTHRSRQCVFTADDNSQCPMSTTASNGYCMEHQAFATKNIEGQLEFALEQLERWGNIQAVQDDHAAREAALATRETTLAARAAILDAKSIDVIIREFFCDRRENHIGEREEKLNAQEAELAAKKDELNAFKEVKRDLAQKISSLRNRLTQSEAAPAMTRAEIDNRAQMDDIKAENQLLQEQTGAFATRMNRLEIDIRKIKDKLCATEIAGHIRASSNTQMAQLTASQESNSSFGWDQETDGEGDGDENSEDELVRYFRLYVVEELRQRRFFL
ncbi:hypothetical protein UCDDS831_g02015 [Diplodia seriata]|uniref:Uncharacterized protein n=1 Tax=Diplodia seriata TaxID=420778 RepID=A0A0G2ESF0_9PEZI|nr:hypothetical protein UCDDS831_g02015 [Diplodia seriata]